MAEQNGFFQAVWDDDLTNPETGLMGDYDLKYYAYQFADYFKLFFRNGVFASPVDQLKVSRSAEMQVTINTGWAFMEGYWYHLDEPLVFTIPSNGSNYSRTDSLMVRLNISTRTVKTLYMAENNTPTRTDTIWDLVLAEIIVPPFATEVPAANITDKRPDQNVCGFVTGLQEIIDTEDLFTQYDAIFNEWFDTVKDQVTGDLAIRLQMEFTQLNQNVEDYYTNTTQDIAQYKAEVKQVADEAKETIDNFVANYFVLPLQILTFTNKICEISDSRVTSNSLVDVYFTAETMDNAEAANIYVDSVEGKIVLTCSLQPTGTIQAMIGVRN